MRLTKSAITRLVAATNDERIYFDDDLPGFGLRLRESGKPTWIVQYRIGRAQRRLTLGKLAALDADKARKLAKDMLAKVQLGSDPAADKRAKVAQASQTLGAVIPLFLDRRRASMRPRSYEELERHLLSHWKPLHDRPIDQITRGEVSLQRGKIEERSGPVAANRARSSLSSFFSWAMGEGLSENNPVVATNKAIERARDRVLTDVELAAIWNACDDDDYGRIVRLLILTGQRREEIGGLSWAEINLAGRLWTLPASRAKNHRQHEIRLSDQATAILEAVPRREGRPQIFGSGQAGFNGWSNAKEALDERLRKTGISIDAWVIHDIRRSVATGMANLAVLPHVIEAMLNHVSGHKAGVAGVYNRSTYAREKRQALDIWAAHVAAIIEGKASNIVPLQAAG